MDCEQMDCDVAYKCCFCNIIFLEFDSLLKHNRYYCHKRQGLPRSSTVTTAILSNPHGGSETSQDSSASHLCESALRMTDEELKFVTTSRFLPQLDAWDLTTLQHNPLFSRVPGAAPGFKAESVAVRLKREHMQPEFPEDAADVKYRTNFQVSSQRLRALSRITSDLVHPTSAAETLQRFLALSKGAGAVPHFGHPTSGATAMQHEHMYFRVPESAADGRLTNFVSPLKREHEDSNALNAREDCEPPESDVKRRKLLDEDELA